MIDEHGSYLDSKIRICPIKSFLWDIVFWSARGMWNPDRKFTWDKSIDSMTWKQLRWQQTIVFGQFLKTQFFLAKKCSFRDVNCCHKSAGIEFRRQNLTSVDVKFWRRKSIPVKANEVDMFFIKLLSIKHLKRNLRTSLLFWSITS